VVGTHACATAGSAQQCVSFEPISGSPVLVALRQSYHELGFVSSMRPSVESSCCKGDEKDALLGEPAVAPGTRRAQANTGPKKVWTPGLPSDWRGRFLIVKKKGLASVRGTRSHDAAGQHRLTIQPGEWSGARCPRLRPARSQRIPNSAHYRPARVSRENTRDQRRTRPGRTAEAVSPPRAKKNPRRTSTSRSTEVKSAYDALSELVECDCR